MLGIERDALERLIETGKIAAYTLHGNRRIAMDELGRYIREHRRDAAGRRTFMEGQTCMD